MFVLLLIVLVFFLLRQEKAIFVHEQHRQLEKTFAEEVIKERDEKREAALSSIANLQKVAQASVLTRVCTFSRDAAAWECACLIHLGQLVVSSLLPSPSIPPSSIKDILELLRCIPLG